jgi:hypothetical protein
VVVAGANAVPNAYNVYATTRTGNRNADTDAQNAETNKKAAAAATPTARTKEEEWGCQQNKDLAGKLGCNWKPDDKGGDDDSKDGKDDRPGNA